ncbi:HSP20 domain-containing protein [Cephalotus follicularis]|uniref:HSP20 domain-containing protein n=1 Tax=Cephalotus follicularis TaxID=3775 RepID=A0A1Q3B5B6_CEPFO|nr:HSP20 domain-containing protein [Cephalotus follicularis]
MSTLHFICYQLNAKRHNYQAITICLIILELRIITQFLISTKKMSQALSTFNLSLLLSSKKTTTGTPISLSSRNPHLFKPHGGGCGYNPIKVMATGDTRDNLDHLQRANRNPKKRVAPVAPTGLWDRFPTARTVQQMMETMEGMMDDPFGYSSGWQSAAGRESERYSRGRTPWEIKEVEGAYKMRFDMPGMTKADVKMWVEEKMLVVKAEKVSKKTSGEEGNGEGEGEGEEWSAKSYGRYSSRIALPDNVQFEKIKAEVKDGVLYITIPKATVSGKILDINVE